MTNDQSPTFCFDGYSADNVSERYWSWLWQQIQQLAAKEPNSKAALARYTKRVLVQETKIASHRPNYKPSTNSYFHLYAI